MSPDARELLDVIVLAMACPNPAAGMELLGKGVALVLAGGVGEAPLAEPTLLPLADEPQDGPIGWDFSDPRFEAIMRPGYEDTAEYHYAMAAHERALRGG